MKYDFLIVGAGFSGSVMAERVATVLNKKVLLIDKRNHIGGNAYDKYDEHGILVHRYGPHIFHTNSKMVFDYLSQFTKWRKYEHKVMAYSKGELYPMPINMLTINKLYNMNLRTEEETKRFFDSVREKRNPTLNSEDIIVDQIGYGLFEKFFKHYTKKQWNHEAKELSPSVCGRVPIRTNTDCRYFTDKYQYMPEEGFTKMFEKMLTNKNIDIILGTDYKSILNDFKYDKMVYTGPIDYFFDYKFGKLPYRSIRFEFENYKKEKVHDVAVVNYVDETEPYTRVTEYKHITGQRAGSTTLTKEYTQKEGEPFYPIPTDENKKLYLLYRNEAEKLTNMVFCGRLSEYQYYNMDQAVANALTAFHNALK